MNSDEYNERIKHEFENHGGIDLLTKYVMSEILPPIADYENAVKIIKMNCCLQMSGELLIIGAYLAIKWTYSRNELLEVLNLMYDYFPDRDKAIINYLNALQIYTRDKRYKKNNAYWDELSKSIAFNTPFVYNRCKMAEIVDRNTAQKYYKDALENVKTVLTEQEIMQLPFEYFLNPQSFIEEHILGTDLSYENYDAIEKNTKLP